MQLLVACLDSDPSTEGKPFVDTYIARSLIFNVIHRLRLLSSHTYGHTDGRISLASS